MHMPKCETWARQPNFLPHPTAVFLTIQTADAVIGPVLLVLVVPGVGVAALVLLAQRLTGRPAGGLAQQHKGNVVNGAAACSAESNVV